jgi:hypothetical protein
MPKHGSRIKRTLWPESANELYRPSDRRLSAKSVPTFADRDRGVSRSQRDGSHMAAISVSYTLAAIFTLQ